MLLLLACSDYAVNQKPADPEGDPADPAETGDLPGETGEPPAEDCEVELAAPRAEADAACAATPPAEPWAMREEWTVAGQVAAYATPSVGDIDADNVPEVLLVVTGSTQFGAPGDLLALDGATGAEEWRALVGEADSMGAAALADLDGDGLSEVVARAADGATVALDASGAELWRAAGVEGLGSPSAIQPAVADLDADGRPEVLSGPLVLDGATGATRLLLPLPSSVYLGRYVSSAAADVDGDGVQEVLWGESAWALDGTPVVTCGDPGAAYSSLTPMQVDADAAPELAFVHDGGVTFCDDDGAVLWEHVTYSHPGVAVGDVDGDGVEDLLVPREGLLQGIRAADGRVVWYGDTQDSSCCATAALWDMDDDGLPEVLIADEQRLHVFSGASGDEVLSSRALTSATAWAGPAVADVDGDGEGEILVANDRTGTALSVFGADGVPWPGARAVWNQHAYVEGAIGDDLSVPAAHTPRWAAPTPLFRGQAAVPVPDDPARPNLRVAVTDVCAVCPDGAAHVAVQVWNDGGADVPAGATLRIDGVADVTLPAVPAGGSVELGVDTTAAALANGVVATVDPDGALEECHEDDGTATWQEDVCR